MSWFELGNVLEVLGEKCKNEAENTRLIMYSIFQSQSTKEIKPSDIMKFEWDNENPEENKYKALLSKDDATIIMNRVKKA